MEQIGTITVNKLVQEKEAAMKTFIRKHQRTNSLIIILAVISVIGLTGHRDVAAGPHVQEMRGTWYGFIQAGHDPVETAVTQITQQQNRRFSGIIDIGGPHVIDGTVSASGKVNYQSKSSAGHFLGHAQLHDFGGGAGILDGTLVRPSTNDRSLIPCVRVLRAFLPDPSAAAPIGRFRGSVEGGGEITISFTEASARGEPNTVEGSLEVVLHDHVHSFRLIATYDREGRIIAIGHKETHGHLMFEARLSQSDPSHPATISGAIEFEFGHGHVLEADFDVEHDSPVVAV
jgi:hypothetical protein